MNHTPGPWYPVLYADKWNIQTSESYGDTDVLRESESTDGPKGVDPEKAAINARLAAAAPKMLDLLKRLREWDQLPECLDGPYWLVEIGNMIAKATGE